MNSHKINNKLLERKESKIKLIPETIQEELLTAIKNLDLEVIKEISTIYDIREFTNTEMGSGTANALLTFISKLPLSPLKWEKDFSEKVFLEKAKSIIDHFIEQGISINAYSGSIIPKTPLAAAIRIEDIELIEYLIQKGANVNALYEGTNDMSGSPLRAIVDLVGFCCRDPRRAANIYKLLLKHGCNTEIKDSTGGCDLFLMPQPNDDKYKKSDKNNLYLYKEKQRFFYMVEKVRVFYISEHNQKHYLEDEKRKLEFPKGTHFNFSEKERIKYDNKKMIQAVLDITSKRGHTAKIYSFESYLEEQINNYSKHLYQKEIHANLLIFKEEVEALKFNTSGTASLFWQSAKKLAEILPDDKLTKLPQPIAKAVTSAKQFRLI